MEDNQSRQSKYQHRHRAAGLCWMCNESVVCKPDGTPTSFCKRHLLETRERNRQRYRKRVGYEPRPHKRKQVIE